MNKTVKKTYTVIAVAALALCVAAIILYYLPSFAYTDDVKQSDLIGDTLIRLFAVVFLVCVLLAGGEGGVLRPRLKGLTTTLLVCLPCFFVAIVNFPFSALVKGVAVVERGDLIWLFVINCILIAVIEEVFFRGIFQAIIYSRLKGRRFDLIWTVVITSAFFALWHLTNLIGGAGIGDTLLQVVYTFLLGCMFSFMFVKTGSLYPCIIAHAVFDVGGRLIPTLGSGVFQDVVFWVLTIAVGVLCGVYVTVMLFKMQKEREE